MIRERPRLVATLGLSTYVLAGLWFTGLPRTPVPQRDEPCAAPLLSRIDDADSTPDLKVLQGNAWMLPERPLLLPYEFSVERRERLERIVRTVRSCRPDVVLLEEMFEQRLVDVLAGSLPEYRVYTSGQSDFTGTVNASGLVTLARVPVTRVSFHPFAALPPAAQTIERLGRKGFLSVTVDTPAFQGDVVNLHLYAFRDTAEERFSREQLDEVLAYARGERAAGRTLLVGGDFNLDRDDLEGLLTPGWAISEHGPTYDPVSNRYTLEGSNDRPDRRFGHGIAARVRSIDHLLSSSARALRVRSGVLRGLALSDHYFLEHRISAARRAD